MQRDLLLPGEMIHAAERAHQLTNGLPLEDLQADRLRSESLLWNFTVLGEAAAQLPGEVLDILTADTDEAPPAQASDTAAGDEPNSED